MLDTLLIPHLKARLAIEHHKEVVEKVLECIRDLADEMGPGALESHMDWVVVTLEQLLDKTAVCQTGQPATMEG